MSLEQKLLPLAIAAALAAYAPESASGQEGTIEPAPAAVEAQSGTAEGGKVVYRFPESSVEGINLTQLIPQLRAQDIYPYDQSPSFPIKDALIFVYNGRERGGEQYPADQNDLFYLQLAQLLRKETDARFLLLRTSEAPGRLDVCTAPGIYLIRNQEVLDRYSDEPDMLYDEAKQETFRCISGWQVAQLRTWLKSPEEWRFFGSYSLRHLDRRRMSISIETANEALQSVQRALNEGRYEAAQRLLGMNQLYGTADDVALREVLSGALDVHLAFDRWRNHGEQIDLDAVVGGATVAYETAVSVNAAYGEAMLGILLNEGVVVLNGRFLNQMSLQSPEQALLARIAASQNEDRDFFRELRETSIRYWREVGHGTADIEQIDVEKVQWDRWRSAMIPADFVVGWETFTTVPGWHSIKTFQRREGEEQIFRDLYWRESGRTVEMVKDEQGRYHALLEP